MGRVSFFGSNLDDCLLQAKTGVQVVCQRGLKESYLVEERLTNVQGLAIHDFSIERIERVLSILLVRVVDEGVLFLSGQRARDIAAHRYAVRVSERAGMMDGVRFNAGRWGGNRSRGAWHTLAPS